MNALLNATQVTFLKVVKFSGENHLDVPRVAGRHETLSKKVHDDRSRSRLLKLIGEPFPYGSKKVVFDERGGYTANTQQATTEKFTNKPVLAHFLDLLDNVYITEQFSMQFRSRDSTNCPSSARHAPAFVSDPE